MTARLVERLGHERRELPPALHLRLYGDAARERDRLDVGGGFVARPDHTLRSEQARRLALARGAAAEVSAAIFGMATDTTDERE
jgi:hypothetical protein